MINIEFGNKETIKFIKDNKTYIENDLNIDFLYQKSLKLNFKN